MKVTSGVPQGTVLGPPLFLICINDLPECINHSEIRLFADDCIVYRCIHNQQDAELLQEDINAIQTWASTWQMNFNVPKCCSIHFTQAITYKMENTYYLYDTPPLSLDHFKYLGITLQSNLRYDRHIQDITAKANRTLGLLRRNVRTSSPQLKECAYKALVRSQLEYASTVWSPRQRYFVDDVKKVQLYSARYIYNDYRSDSSVSTMIKNLHWDSLETRRTKSSLVMFYKMINNLAAIPYEHYIKPITNSTTRHSHQHKILPLSSSKNAFKFSFIPRTIPIWNSLPEELVNCNSISTFRTKLDNNYHYK